jgi:integrase/recombinase XerD
MKLSAAAKKYTQWKNVRGIRFIKGKAALVGLLRHAGNVDLSSIGARQISEHLDDSRMAPDTWWREYQFLRSFFQFWVARGKLSKVPMPRPRSALPPPFKPFIFTLDQLRRLTDDAGRWRRDGPRRFDPLTFQTVLLFLYGTGALVHEAIGLRLSEVDLDTRIVTLRRLNGERKRIVPLSITMQRILRAYLSSTMARRQASDIFFLSAEGTPISRAVLIYSFVRLCQRNGISQDHRTNRTPGLHDLRHTFAVRCLNAWLERGKDVRMMLPALSAYLGHVDPSSTEQYLKIVPARFSKHLFKLSGDSPTQ